MKRANLLAVGLIGLLAACSEPPLATPAPGYENDAWPDQMRGRTLRQDESRRIYP